MVKASRIQDKVKGVGFDWEEPHQVWEKVQEELSELQHEVATANQDKIEAEFGDVLFSMINYARFLKVNPEDALERTNKKFMKRFMHLESKANEIGKPLSEMTLAEMDVFWERSEEIVVFSLSKQLNDDSKNTRTAVLRRDFYIRQNGSGS